ncbi:MAG: DUF3109 family protein [Flavobacteriales bacterium]|nr:DUF3109 family protein [Flavobacteriales bacterium]
MIQIDRTLISKDILKEKFVCDLNACKGACCVAGEGGAPIEDEEIEQVLDQLDEIKPFLRPEGIAAIEKDGVWYRDVDGEKLTTLVEGKECAFVIFDEKGITKCGIEAAHVAGKTDFKKPISCHLYPIRLKKYENFTAVNYHEWDICQPACACGSELDVKVFRFLREPLIREFGEEWYTKLEAADDYLHQ